MKIVIIECSNDDINNDEMMKLMKINDNENENNKY